MSCLRTLLGKDQAKERFGALCSLGSCRRMSTWCIVQFWLVQANKHLFRLLHAKEHFGALCSFGSCWRRSVWCLVQFWLVQAKERLVPYAFLARAGKGAIGALRILGSCRQMSILVEFVLSKVRSILLMFFTSGGARRIILDESLGEEVM
ncbi:hypothetical protein L3X38_027275 [Prunus dulcis]|uniref:Uncharacterized protein n=1 Tax=Prunus dulcis TaxID=3755 RepID=A0AAD4Z096_PRUDU|nr:hypothetical protein L3X38_027275 [Prunus dulcis]